MYKCNSLILQQLAGAQLPHNAAPATYNGIAVEPFPRVVLSPSFAPLLSDVKVRAEARRQGEQKRNGCPLPERATQLERECILLPLFFAPVAAHKRCGLCRPGLPLNTSSYSAQTMHDLPCSHRLLPCTHTLLRLGSCGPCVPQAAHVLTHNSFHPPLPRFDVPPLWRLQAKVAPGSIKLLTPESVLILDGPDISVTGPIEVEGALVVRAVPGARVSLGPLQVRGYGG